MSPSPVTDAATSARVKADVMAGGAVCFRERDGVLDVLLVHRPKYNDWSWPKGKADKGETLPETAVREVEEETGYRITLGRPLPEAKYTVGKGSKKHVAYWAAEIVSDDTPEPGNPREVDEARWVPASDATRLLTRYGDREQLDVVTRAFSKGDLRTWPLLVVRHGKAYDRSTWSKSDAKRPLISVGVRQAQSLTCMLAAWAPSRVYSSPWKRCLTTVTPYAESIGKNVKQKDELSEKAHSKTPVKVAEFLAKLVEKSEPAIVCTHRPVLPTVLSTLAGLAPAAVAADLPNSDPYLSPGEVIVASVRRSATPRVLAVERYRPIDD